MPAEHTIRWLVLGGLVLLLAIFASSETSLFALTPLERLRLKEKKPRLGESVDSLLTRPRRLLVTLLIGVETINILAAVIATSLALSLWGPRGKWLALWVVAPVFLLLGEIIPKSLALAYPSRLVRWLAPLMRPTIFLLTPFRVVFLQISRGLLATLGFRADLPVPAVHQEDFVRMVEESRQVGMIAAMERDFIRNLLTLGEVRVGQLMVPRPDIFCLPIDMPVPELIQAVKRSRFSRVPIYRDHLGDVLGILHAKDLLALPAKPGEEARGIEHLLRPPYYVPENKKAFDLLTELQSKRVRLALVVDEYGALVGQVSVEDLLEELCGEIPQEYAKEEKVLEEKAPGVWWVKASLSLTDFNEALGLNLPSEEFDSIGGLVFNLFGELPREGDLVSFDNLTFKVLKAKGTRILELEVQRGAP